MEGTENQAPEDYLEPEDYPPMEEHQLQYAQPPPPAPFPTPPPKVHLTQNRILRRNLTLSLKDMCPPSPSTSSSRLDLAMHNNPNCSRMPMT
jgi:hypothetical protein